MRRLSRVDLGVRYPAATGQDGTFVRCVAMTFGRQFDFASGHSNADSQLLIICGLTFVIHGKAMNWKFLFVRGQLRAVSWRATAAQTIDT
jgi:hypothetical protein